MAAGNAARMGAPDPHERRHHRRGDGEMGQLRPARLGPAGLEVSLSAAHRAAPERFFCRRRHRTALEGVAPVMLARVTILLLALGVAACSTTRPPPPHISPPVPGWATLGMPKEPAALTAPSDGPARARRAGPDPAEAVLVEGPSTPHSQRPGKTKNLERSEKIRRNATQLQ